MRLFLAVVLAAVPIIPMSQTKRGCTHVIGMRDLRVYYERILVVAKKEMPAGEPDEYWVIFPEREQKIDRAGRILTSNVPAEQVLFLSPKDGPAVVMRKMRVCKCPAALWGAVSGFSAEH